MTELTNCIEWRFPSSSGRNEINFVQNGLSYDGTRLFKIDIIGRSWDLCVELSESSMVTDFENTLLQVPVSDEAVRRLRNYLQSWISQRELFDMVLSESSDHILHLSLEVREDYITSLQKPALVFCYESSPLRHLECMFVIDDTCALMAIEGMTIK